MQPRIAILVCSVAMAGAAQSGCATGGSGAVPQTFIQQCRAAAKTEEERSACAWENASRMADGGP